jgi:short subunit dehydrogenase-like uncharacterized protein
MILVFGATGFSGRMVVEQLVARGLPVRAAARSEAKLAALADDFPGIETTVADVAAPESVRRAAKNCALLITTVGPYTKFGDVAAEAALAESIPYVDITGEPAWLRRVFGEFGARAAGQGVAMIPAFGYDYVPGNLAGALALERYGEAAVRLDIAYFLAGSNERSTESFSKGTLDSLDASSRERGFAFAGGALSDVDGPRKKFEFELDGAPLTAVAIGGSEHFTLPRLAPWLTDVNVALGWFSPGEQRSEAPISGDGPSEQKRAESRARVFAIARDAAGKTFGEVRVTGPNPYDMSGLLSAWAAEQILAGNLRGSGALGPVDAFGLDELRAGCAQIGLTAS